ncbi:MAG: DUF4349 domain-containing protein [Haloferacaceae archaeon]
MSRRRVAALVAVLVLVAGCTGAGAGGGGDAAASQSEPLARSGGAATVDEGAPKAEDTGGDGGAGGTVAQVQNRKLIRTATVRLRVEDYDRARERLATAASRRGGFVSDASSRLHTTDAGNYTTGQVVFRVPSEEFDAFLAEVNRTGTVLESRQNTKDVTDQLVDINARLRNLRAERDRLRELYQQANDTEAILKVERRLSEVQTRIERLEAQRESLNRRVALSTVTVELVEPRPDAVPGAGEQWYDTPLTEAFFSSVSGVVVALRAITVGLAYALPYLIVFVGPPVVGGVIVVRRFLRGEDDSDGDGAANLGPTEGGDGGGGDDGSGDDGDASDGAAADADGETDASTTAEASAKGETPTDADGPGTDETPTDDPDDA